MKPVMPLTEERKRRREARWEAKYYTAQRLEVMLMYARLCLLGAVFGIPYAGYCLYQRYKN